MSDNGNRLSNNSYKQTDKRLEFVIRIRFNRLNVPLYVQSQAVILYTNLIRVNRVSKSSVNYI